MKSTLVFLTALLLAPLAALRAAEFVPDVKINPDNDTVLMAADGKNPGGLRAWNNDHRRMQVKNLPWPTDNLGGRGWRLPRQRAVQPQGHQQKLPGLQDEAHVAPN